MSATISGLKSAPKQALKPELVEERLKIALKTLHSEEMVEDWFTRVRSGPSSSPEALEEEQNAFKQLKEKLNEIRRSGEQDVFEDLDLTTPHGARQATVSGTLYYPTMHTDLNIVTMQKFTPRSLIRKGFPRNNTYLYNSFPIKRDEKTVRGRGTKPPLFNLGTTEEKLVDVCYENSAAILFERARNPTFNVIYGSHNRDGVVSRLLKRLEELPDDFTVGSIDLNLPAIAWPERKISATEANVVRLHTVVSKSQITAIYVIACHPSDGMASIKRTGKLWHDGCNLDSITNFAVHLAGGTVSDLWQSFYMSTCHPQEEDVAPDADQWYVAERVWLNALRGEEISSGIRTAPSAVPLHLLQRLDAVNLTPESFEEDVRSGKEKRSFLEVAAVAVHATNFSKESAERWMSAQQKRGLEQDESAAAQQANWLEENAGIFQGEGSRKAKRGKKSASYVGWVWARDV